MFYKEKEELRVVAWRQWRNSLKEKSTTQQLEEISAVCASIPFTSQHLSHDLKHEWPDPWELVYYDLYDEYSIALIAFYTLALLEHDCAIHAVNTPHGIELLVEANNSFLNYPWGSLVNTLPEECKILDTYTKRDFDLE